MRERLRQLFFTAWFNFLLFAGNILGALYGFYWYAGQFAATPVYFWPFIANSPLAVLYYFLALLYLRRGKRSPLWEGLAYFGLIKHGLWTVSIVTIYQLRGNIYPDNYLLWSGHLVMALQAALSWYIFGLPLSLRQAAAVAVWYLFNDYLDYNLGIHPWVDSTVVSTSLIRTLALVLTLSLTAAYLFSSAPHRELKGRKRAE